jgi:carboxymethylenebutenolidase
MRSGLLFLLILCFAAAAGAEPLAFDTTLTVNGWPLQAYNALTVDWQLRQWSGAAEASADARASGAWRLTFADRHVEVGAFEAVQRGEALTATLLIGQTVTRFAVQMQRVGDHTQISLHHAFADSSPSELSPADTLRQFWAVRLPKLTGYLNDMPGGYLAVPRGTGPFPAVLVLHDRFGLNRTTRGFCDSLAAAGYEALAVDMFRGDVTGDLQQAAHFLDLIDRSEALKEAQTGLRKLKSRADVLPGKTAVWGLGMGADMAIGLAAREPKLKGLTLWQAATAGDPDTLQRISCPVLAIFGDADDKQPRPQITSFTQALVQAGIRVESQVVAPSGADFSDPAYGIGFNAAALQTAWQSTLRFFDKQLR